MMHQYIILAYLDPGTGSIVVQVILASLLAVAVAARLFWRKVKGIFTRGNPVEDVEELDEDE